MTVTGLEVRGLHKRYGGVDALAGVDLAVPAGTVHGLIGPNGAGKTTLLSIVLGLTRAGAGTVHLGGQPLARVAGQVPGGVAGSVEEPRFYPFLSAQANLELLVRLDDPGGLAPRVALARVGLGDKAQSKARGLSMGMRQRLMVAAALVRRPGLLVLDEPTGGLDPTGAAELLALVRRLSADGCGVLLTSHDLATVAEACDNVTVLVGGSVVRTAPTSTLIAEAPAPTYRLLTSDDLAAQCLLLRANGLTVTPAGDGLEVSATQAVMDGAVLRLAAVDIAVRRLETTQSPLRALYDQLTGIDDQEGAA